jgi:hypothetical protein
MTYRDNEVLTTFLGLGLIAWVAYKTRANYNVDPGLVGVQKNTTDLQISGETVPDMDNYTDVSALNGVESDALIVASTQMLRTKTNMCWDPIETQYATRYTNPTTGESIIWSRITFSAVKKFFARDYTIAMKDGVVIYIQTQSKFSDDPNAPKPYNRNENYNKPVENSVDLLNQMNS